MPVHAGEGGLTAVVYPRALVDEIARAAEADPLREVCGFIVRRPGGLSLQPVANGADPALARTRFAMDALEVLRILRGLEREGGEVVAIFHSHVDGDARLSRADRDHAMDGDVPLWAGVEHIVVGLRRGRASEVRRYRLAGRDFHEYPLD